ncbi:MAG: TspO/MBR family protein [Sulfurifustis sp.]
MPVSTQVLGLAGWLVLTFAAAAIGAAASVNAGAFYAQLVRPSWAPPAWLFGPAWAVLYALMGVAAWRVWCSNGYRAAAGALNLFVIQLLINASWSWLFFAWRRGALAFADFLILWVLVLGTIVAFWRINALAAVLLIPYVAWITFAAALNWSIWRMNPSILG